MAFPRTRVVLRVSVIVIVSQVIEATSEKESGQESAEPAYVIDQPRLATSLADAHLAGSMSPCSSCNYDDEEPKHA